MIFVILEVSVNGEKIDVLKQSKPDSWDKGYPSITSIQLAQCLEIDHSIIQETIKRFNNGIIKKKNRYYVIPYRKLFALVSIIPFDNYRIRYEAVIKLQRLINEIHISNYLNAEYLNRIDLTRKVYKTILKYCWDRPFLFSYLKRKVIALGFDEDDFNEAITMLETSGILIKCLAEDEVYYLVSRAAKQKISWDR